MSVIRFSKRTAKIDARTRVEAGPKIEIDPKIEAKPKIKIELILLMSLFHLLEFANLDYTNFREIKLNAKLFKKFFLLNDISLTLTKLFSK